MKNGQNSSWLGMFLTVKQKILVILLEKGPLQNNEIAKKAGITEQWCSETINALHEEGLIESQFIAPRRINKLTNRGVEVAKHLKEISESTTNLKTEVKMLRSYSKIRA